MEITKKPKIKSIPYDEFMDNESLEKLVKELNAGGANVALGVLDDFTIPAFLSSVLSACRLLWWMPFCLLR